MANAADSEIKECSKTQLILSILADQGPKTEYELYKQLPKISHGTIHYCLDKLAHSGAIAYVQSKHKKNQTKKQYYLTFIGTLTRVASFLHWWNKDLTESQEGERWKRFEEKRQEEMVEFLAMQGKLLNYALFEEIHWLVKHFPGVARVYAILANVILEDPPSPFWNPLIAAVAARGNASHLDSKGFGGKIRRAQIIEHLQDAYRREFTRQFFEVVVIMKHRGEATANAKLRQQAQKELEEEKHALAGLEYALRFFDRQEKQK
jgi:DNA-binding PadR family transcriptional regulator